MSFNQSLNLISFSKSLIIILIGLFLFFSKLTLAQTTFPVNGPFDERPEVFALTNAYITIASGQVVENGTLVVKKGIIEGVGNDIRIPENAVIYDLQGAHIYPSFIDLYTSYGIKELSGENRNRSEGPQFLSEKKGSFGWNEAIKPEIRAHHLFHHEKSKAENFRNQGFGAVLTHQTDGIARGTGTFVSLNDKSDNEVVLKDMASAHYSFDKGISTQDYPGSLMGAIALIRQTYLDSEWYQKGGSEKEYNISLDNWNKIQSLPQFFEVIDWLTLLRAEKIANEFNVNYIYKGAGDEYQRLDAIKNTGRPLVIPLNFPDAFDVSDPYDALNVSLADMMHWEMAPSNAAFLENYDIDFSITGYGLENINQFRKRLEKAIKHGLSKEMAMKALTTVPAQILGLGDKIGTLEKGKIANFLVTSGDIFDASTSIYQNWIQGVSHKVTDYDFIDIRGTYQLTLGDMRTFNLIIDGEAHDVNVKLQQDTIEKKIHFERKHFLISMMFEDPSSTVKGSIRLSGQLNMNDDFSGNGISENGQPISWSATKTSPHEDSVEEKEEESYDTLPDIRFPFVGYGLLEQPEQDVFLIQNATLWTNEDEGVLQNADILIRNGKIVSVGQNITPPSNAIIIIGEGKHVSPGMIDEHSHIAISRGVNEWTQSITSEVRIGDVINSEDINIFRQLSGGVTMAQLLHGSANAIGGQAQLIKLRWGSLPEEMKVDYAPGYIKFALGENVKQSNWGDRNTVRYPQTRMGVEQVYYDAFTRAKEYQQEWNTFNALNRRQRANATPPRRNLELEALSEILNEERFITCHSYVQSEINMLMKAAEDLGFRVQIFTHILEGYKVADKMKEHGAGGSSFADWWSFKFEVIDAIAHNAAIMNEVGVLTAINSDDAEMGRRLNQEASKTVKYGGASEEDALKMVTLNPAILLQVDHRTGSLKAGKDADIVIWSDHPLSIFAVAEKTFVDGRLLYDRDNLHEILESIDAERHRLSKRMLEAKANGERVRKPQKQHQHIYHCDDIHDYRFEHHLHDHGHGHGHGHGH